MLILGIETSCDETSVALVEAGRQVRSNLVFSQVRMHAEFGGVVPELAAREHLRRLPTLLDAAIEEAGVAPAEVAMIAATRGPGLVGCLLVGHSFGQGLAAAWEKPFVGISHLWGHVYSGFLADPDLEPPVLALVVSGAHTDLVLMPEHGRFEVLGRTRDDAAGEAFDKAARMLDLGYPGGPALDRMAEQGQAAAQPLPVPHLPGYEFSFSGLKTALLYRVRDLGGAGEQLPVADLAAAFRHSVVESIVAKLREAVEEFDVTGVVLCGGVAANSRLRRRAAEVIGGRTRLVVPAPELCTDNAAMIAAAAAFAGSHAPRFAGVDPSLPW